MAGHNFGGSVAISGDLVLVGAPNDDTNGARVGQVHLFDTDGSLLRTFIDPTPTTEDRFGYSGRHRLIAGKRHPRRRQRHCGRFGNRLR